MCGGIKSCCCCFSLRSGSIIAASFLMSVSAVNVASVVLRKFNFDVPNKVCYASDIKVSKGQCIKILEYGATAMLVSALMDCFYVLCAILLLFGIFRKSEVMMLPFMSMTIIQTLRIGIITVGSILAYYVMRLNMVVLINSSLIHLVVMVYLGVVVYNYYPRIMRAMFRDWYMEMKKKRAENLVTALEPMAKIPIAWIDPESNGALSRSDSFMTLQVAKDVEKAKICKDLLCVLVPMLIVGAAWTAMEFFLHQYL